MNKRNYIMYLEDMIDCMEKIEDYSSGFIYEDFAKDRLVIDAVIRNLEVIGEAAKNVPKEIKEYYPNVAWKSMIGLRNILIHEYFGVDLEILWEIIRHDLPQTKPLIGCILKEI